MLKYSELLALQERSVDFEFALLKYAISLISMVLQMSAWMF